MDIVWSFCIFWFWLYRWGLPIPIFTDSSQPENWYIQFILLRTHTIFLWKTHICLWLETHLHFIHINKWLCQLCFAHSEFLSVISPFMMCEANLSCVKYKVKLSLNCYVGTRRSPGALLSKEREARGQRPWGWARRRRRQEMAAKWGRRRSGGDGGEEWGEGFGGEVVAGGNRFLG